MKGRMSKIRINDLARELEVKSKSILDVLPEIGVTEKKSHSSSLEDHEADKVRARLRASSAAQTSSRSSRPTRADTDEIKTKIDLSHISKPGDALKAIISKQQPSAAVEAPPVAAPPPRPAASAAPPAAAMPAPKTPAPPAVAPPKFVVPTSTPRPSFTAPAPAPPQSAAPAAPVAPRPAVPPAAPPLSANSPAAPPPRPAAPP